MQKINNANTANKINKAEKIVDFFKTVLIYALTVSMITAAGIYINARQNYGQTAEIPLEQRRIIENGGVISAAKSEMNRNQVNPVQITVTVENDSRTCIYDDILISKVYEDFKVTVYGLLKSSECKILDKTEGDALWKKCAEKTNSVYIRYAGDYIYPVLCAFLDTSADAGATAADAANSGDLSDNSVSSINNIARVRELFIADENPVYGVARDSDGNVAVFSPGESISSYISSQLDTKSLQYAYNDSAGGIPCKFLKDGDIKSETGINKNNIQNL
ncbi:MAG: hypothetical protein FWD71_18800, partial [Oscillospiraceae bacterium]|nr:hypothetical protein [Oscillospiraceae bacterium]